MPIQTTEPCVRPPRQPYLELRWSIPAVGRMRVSSHDRMRMETQFHALAKRGFEAVLICDGRTIARVVQMRGPDGTNAKAAIIEWDRGHDGTS